MQGVDLSMQWHTHSSGISFPPHWASVCSVDHSESCHVCPAWEMSTHCKCGHINSNAKGSCWLLPLLCSTSHMHTNWKLLTSVFKWTDLCRYWLNCAPLFNILCVSLLCSFITSEWKKLTRKRLCMGLLIVQAKGPLLTIQSLLCNNCLSKVWKYRKWVVTITSWWFTTLEKHYRCLYHTLL